MDNNITKIGEEQIPSILPDISNKISLNSKAKIFVERYIQDNNATKACEGLYKNPYSASKRLMSNATIRAYIEKRMASLAVQVQLNKPQFIAKLHRLEEKLEKASRLSDLTKLYTLEASVLGLTKDTGVEQQINIFGTLEAASKLFDIKSNVIDVDKAG